MQSLTVSNKQKGFTLVEVVAVTVIVVVLAASAIPRIGSGGVAARTAADQVLAALHYAQVLAQRQGVVTSVVVTAGTNRLTVNQTGIVSFPIQNYDGTDTGGKYDVKLHPSVSLSSGTITYGVDGIPTAGVGSYNITGNGMSFTIKVESTGFAHFV